MRVPPKHKVKIKTLRVSEETHTALFERCRKGETVEQLILRLMRDIENVYFEIIQVDGKPPEGYSVVYTIGHAKYLYNNGKYALLSRL
jgi:hypothetical protein